MHLSYPPARATSTFCRAAAAARPATIAAPLRTDGHSPGRWRVAAPLSNMAAFAPDFGGQAGDAMVAAEPATVW